MVNKVQNPELIWASEPVKGKVPATKRKAPKKQVVELGYDYIVACLPMIFVLHNLSNLHPAPHRDNEGIMYG